MVGLFAVKPPIVEQVKPVVTPLELELGPVWTSPCARAEMESPSLFAQMQAIAVREIKNAATP